MSDAQEKPEAPESWEELREFIRSGDRAGVDALLTRLEPAENVRALFRLSDEEQESLFELLTPERAAELFEDLPDAHASDLIERLDADHAADIVEALASDHRADLIGSLEAGDADAILDEMVPSIAESVRGLIAYPADTAGGLMATEHFAYPDTALLEDFLTDLRNRRGRSRQLPQRVVLLDQLGRPSGAVETSSSGRLERGR